MKVARLVRRLKRGAPWAGWSFAGFRATDREDGAVVTLTEAAGSLDVHIETTPGLKVSFRPSPGTSTDAARAPIEAIASALRG